MTSVARPFAAFEGTKLYDFVAALPLIVWYVFCGLQLLPALAADLRAAARGPIDPLVLADACSRSLSLLFVAALLVLLTVRRTPKAKASGLLPRLAAIVGTYLGVTILLLPPVKLSIAFDLLSALLILCGTGFALFAVLRLGRSISIMPEARRLVTQSPYSAIRHPLYLGEAIALFGIALQYISPLALLLFGLHFAFQLQRMKNEEAVLTLTFPEYPAYSARTARLVPGIY